MTAWLTRGLLLALVSVSLAAQTRQPWGKTQGGEAVFLYTLTNAKGMEARIANFGAILVSLKVPDRAGRPADVVLGFDSLQEYVQAKRYYGATVGRFANRIAPDIVVTPVVLKRLGSVGSCHSCFGNVRRGRSHRGELGNAQTYLKEKGFTVVPTVPRLPSASKGAHSRRCAGSVSACQTFSGGWGSSLTRMSVHFSPSFRTCAPLAGPGLYCSRSVIFFVLSSFSLAFD